MNHQKIETGQTVLVVEKTLSNFYPYIYIKELLTRLEKIGEIVEIHYENGRGETGKNKVKVVMIPEWPMITRSKIVPDLAETAKDPSALPE